MEIELITTNEQFRSLMRRRVVAGGNDNRLGIVDGGFASKNVDEERDVSDMYSGKVDSGVLESYDTFGKLIGSVLSSYEGSFESLANENVRLAEAVSDKDEEIKGLRAEIEQLKADKLSMCDDIKDAKQDIKRLKKANKWLKRQNKMLSDTATIAVNNVSLMKQRNEITDIGDADEQAGAGEKCFTSRQQAIAFMLLLEDRGINTSNTHKKTIAEMISAFTGCSLHSVRRKLDIEYDDENDRKNLRIVANWLNPLIPGLATKIYNSISDK